ncbi:hypothetical protein BDR03DRAFT_1017114 [Suillus americanus]|nr:hypothetical protein BDR03DRAFT_1017114 [Suillus americanus]
MFDEPSMSMDAGEDGTMAQSQKCKRTAGDNPLLVWIKEHDTYLLEIIWLDGCGLQQYATVLWWMLTGKSCPVSHPSHTGMEQRIL